MNHLLPLACDTLVAGPENRLSPIASIHPRRYY